MMRALCLVIGLAAATTGSAADWQERAAAGRWWPLQAAPKGLVIVESTSFEAGDGNKILSPDHMLTQSLAGLAARAVNEGRHDELVWIGTGNAAYREWFERMQGEWSYEIRATLTPWELLARYHDADLVKGYVLYRYDASPGPLYEFRGDSDRSVNVATVAAAVEQGVLIEESQEERARAMGLERLFDARGHDEAWAFEHYRDRLNRNLLLTAEPRVPHNRAYAIAHRAFVCFGTEEPLPAALAWLEPLSPILGWNMGGESDHTLPVSEWGHFQTASNWALNLTVLSAGSERVEPKSTPAMNPNRLDWSDASPMAAFLMSDGDNVQWQMGDFFHSPKYWANEAHDAVPIGWSMCLTQLVQVCPYAAHKAAEEKPESSTLSEHGGGYYYPDRFASKRPDRLALLRAHARRIHANMAMTGTSVLSFICMDVDSPEAREAYAVFAEEMPGLLGMIVYQYHPYEGGFGEVFWARNSSGVEIPVVSARFSIWELQRSDTRGTPAKVARMLNQLASDTQPPGEGAHAMVAAHAWSRFQRAPGADEHAEDIPMEARDGMPYEQGLLPVHRVAERIESPVRVVSPEECLWRLRMQHDPVATDALLDALP